MVQSLTTTTITPTPTPTIMRTPKMRISMYPFIRKIGDREMQSNDSDSSSASVSQSVSYLDLFN